MRPRIVPTCLPPLTIAAAALLSACGSSSGPTTSGTVVGSYYRNAIVCADNNNNGHCDADEPSTRTDANGAFTLNGQGFDIIAEIGTDAVRVDPADSSTTPVTDPIVLRSHRLSGSTVLSALSTLVANEIDAAGDRTKALTAVAARLGLDAGTDPQKLLADYNTETDPLVKSVLKSHGNNALVLIAGAVRGANGDVRGALRDALAAARVDPNVRYVWLQVGTSEAMPFSKIAITASSATGVALNANPVGKVADTATYTVVDASGGQSVAAGTLIARAITTSTTCPSAWLDGKAVPMSVRAPAGLQVDANGQYATGSKTVPVKADFAVTTCELKIPAGTRSASVNGRALKVPAPGGKPNRVLVIGDTGCRIKGPTAYNNGSGGDPLQDCTDERAWPFRRLAAIAASFDPDLIVHNGDIHYREGVPVGVEVPAGIAGATKNEDWLAQKGLTPTVTYGWAAWEADFFKPAGPLLAGAPWAITRGNHESCFRAGAGWFRFLDPRGYPGADAKYSPTYDAATCSDYIDPVAITLGDLQLALLDNGALQDDPGQGKNQGWTHGDHVRTARQLNALAALPDSKDPAKVTWIVTHKPMFAYSGGAGAATPRTWQYQKAIAASGVAGTETYAGGNGTLPSNAQMLHAGHIHGWQMISHPAATNLPTSFLIGVSGDTLEAGFMFDTTTGQPLAPANFGNAITTGIWPWLGTKAATWFGSLSAYLPDAFSTSPIDNAGDPAKAHISEFGFVVFDRLPGTTNWKGSFYDIDGKRKRTCTTTGKRTSCDG